MLVGVAKSIPPYVVPTERSCTAVFELFPGCTRVASPKSVYPDAATAVVPWTSARDASTKATSVSLSVYINAISHLYTTNAKAGIVHVAHRERNDSMTLFFAALEDVSPSYI